MGGPGSGRKKGSGAGKKSGSKNSNTRTPAERKLFHRKQLRLAKKLGIRDQVAFR